MCFLTQVEVLGGHVVQSAFEVAVNVLVFVEEKLAVAEVDQLDAIGHVDQNVLRL